MKVQLKRRSNQRGKEDCKILNERKDRRVKHNLNVMVEINVLEIL